MSVHDIGYDVWTDYFSRMNLQDILHVGRTCKYLNSTVNRYIKENMLISKTIQAFKRISELNRSLYNYTILSDSETFFPDKQQNAEREIHLTLFGRLDQVDEETPESTWVCDGVIDIMDELYLWIKNEYIESRLNFMIDQITEYANKRYNIKDEKLRKIHEEKIGSKLPYKITKSIMDEKTKYIKENTQRVREIHNRRYREPEVEIDRVTTWVKESMVYFMKPLMETMIVIGCRFRSEEIRKVLNNGWLDFYPDLQGRCDNMLNIKE